MNDFSLIENRQVRVFISSTFQDMQDERDQLMKKTFPVLRQKAAARDVTLTELDLRWGITPEESQSGKVVEICLREIENSFPFFIGIIGNRYGWIPGENDLGENLVGRFGQVRGYVQRHLSVTEMEMQFGVLEKKENLNAFFFIKGQESDDVDEPEKLKELKEAVRKNGRYPVSTYSSPEDLARQVEEAFSQLLDELFPETSLSELEKERLGQRSYLNSLCQNYIRTEKNFAAIEEWMSDWERHQLVITGASGLGKSALAANWVKEKLLEKEELPYNIIYHFVGNGGSLGSHNHIIKTLCDELRDRYGFDKETPAEERKTDEKALENLFNMVAAEGDRPLLIVLDAVNQIIDTDNAKLLNWLPIPPKKVKILFTTLEADTTMEVFRTRHYPVFTLQPLTKEQRKQMISGYLDLYSKKLQPYQIERIVNDTQCENTLVLKTLLDELVNFGVYEKLDEKIDSYLGAESIESFYQILLEGYESDHGKTFVCHILSLIAVSRNGLSEEEILGITKETPLHWSQFYCAIRQHLVTKNGLISFAHGYLRRAVESRYLEGNAKEANKFRREIVGQLKEESSHRAMDEVPYQYFQLDDLTNLHDFLLDLDAFMYLKEKEENTLGKYWGKLIDTGQYTLDEYLPLTEKASILSALSEFTRTTIVNPELSLLFIEKALKYAEDEKEKASILNRLSLSYALSGNYKKALDYIKKVLKKDLDLFGENHPVVATSYNNIGYEYSYLGDHQKALEYYEKALKMRLDIFGEKHPYVATSYNNVGLEYSYLGDHQKALEYEEKALKMRLYIFGEKHPDVAASYNNVGDDYGELGDHQKALKYKDKALKIWLDIFGEKHPDVATAYNNVGYEYSKLGDHQKALEYYEKTLKRRLDIFGEKHPDVATVYNNVGLEYSYLGDHQKALEYEEKALKMRLDIFGEMHPDIAESYNNVGSEYGELGDHQKALDYIKKALKIRLDIFGEQHPDVAASYNNVGLEYGKLGDFQKALEFMEKALKIWLDIFGEKHPNVATAYNNIGAEYGYLENHQKALEYKEKALKIYLEIFGEEYPDVVRLYENVGDEYSELDDCKKAAENMEKALKIRLSVGGELD